MRRVIDHDVLERVLSTAMRSGGEFAEVYAEDKRSTSAGLDDGRVEQVTSGRDRGAGIRVIAGETTGFAHTSDLSEARPAARPPRPPRRRPARVAAARARSPSTRRTTTPRNTVERFPDEVAKADKVELLRRIDDAARSAGAAIVQVSAGYADSRKRVLVANSDGLLADDEVVRLLLRISAVADGDTGMQTGFQSMGHTVGFEIFDTVDVEELARDAARQAITKLGARPAPSGSMPVVIKHGTGGVLFHEACGHGLEADHIAKGASVYAGKVGELVASPLVTVVDDGTMAGEWGTLSIDDEGHPTQRNVLIQDGVLTDYMWDYLRSRKEGRAPSGNGRRQSYMHLPMVRMTNTFVIDGASDPDDIVGATERGVYIARLGGGQVNTASGDFVFGMTEAYLIEDGEITEPLREAQPHRQRPAGAARHRRRRQRLRHGRPGHVRQGRPGRARRHRPADAARRRRSPIGGTACVSGRGVDDLQALADKIVAQADAGEQIEAYVSRGGETEVRVYEGEVEHFVSAQSEGIGVRVIRDGRTGFAYAGTLDPGAVDEVLAEARDNVAFGTVDEWAGLAEPDGVARTPQPLWNDELASVPDRAQDRAGQGARAAHARRRRARPGRRRQLRRRVGRGRRRHDDRHPRERPRERLLRERQHARRRRRRDADRVRLQRRPPPRAVRPRQGRRRRRRSGDPPARRHEAGEPPPHRRARPVRDGPVPRRHRLDAERRERRQGPQPVPRPARRAGRGERRDARRRPDEPATPTPPPTSTARASRRAATS